MFVFEIYVFLYIGDIPAYNCALDGQDSGCLLNPAIYYTKRTFPPIRPSNSVPPCNTTTTGVTSIVSSSADTTTNETSNNNKTKEKLASYYSPSIDPCWLSVGSYVTAG